MTAHSHANYVIGSKKFIFPVCVLVQSFFGLGQSADVTIELEDVEKRKKVDVKNEEGKKEKLFLYYDGESVSGKVCVSVCE